jgi:hypothetical protein
MWPTTLAFLLFIACRVYISTLALCFTLALYHRHRYLSLHLFFVNLSPFCPSACMSTQNWECPLRQTLERKYCCFNHYARRNTQTLLYNLKKNGHFPLHLTFCVISENVFWPHLYSAFPRCIFFLSETHISWSVKVNLLKRSGNFTYDQV